MTATERSTRRRRLRAQEVARLRAALNLIRTAGDDAWWPARDRGPEYAQGHSDARAWARGVAHEALTADE